MEQDFAFGRSNFIWIGIAVVLLIIGFSLMSGGGSDDGLSYNPLIFSTRRIVIAPIVTMLGFITMIYSILKDTKSDTK